MVNHVFNLDDEIIWQDSKWGVKPLRGYLFRWSQSQSEEIFIFFLFRSQKYAQSFFVHCMVFGIAIAIKYALEKPDNGVRG